MSRSLFRAFPRKPSGWAAIFAALLVSFCGWPVLFSQSREGFFAPWAAMPFNAALAIALLGLTLALMELKEKRATGMLGALVFLAGAATLLQYILRADFGIDQFLRAGQASALSGFPGRMAPNSAACLTSMGIAILLFSRLSGGAALVAACLLAALPACLGFVTLVSNLMGVSGSFDPGSFSHMALPTATGLTLAGVVVTGKALRSLKNSSTDNYRARPLLLTIAMLFGAIALWQFLITQERRHIESIVALRAEDTKQNLQEKLNGISLAIKRMAMRTSLAGSGNKTLLTTDAHAYLDHIPVLKRIGLVDASYNVIWSYPEYLSHQVRNFRQNENSHRKRAVDEAVRRGEPVLSQVIELRSGGKGFILPMKVQRKGDPAVALYASIDAGDLFRSVHDSADLRIVVRENGEPVFSDPSLSEIIRISHKTKFSWAESRWEIDLFPNKKFYSKHDSLVPYLALLFGVIVSLLLGSAAQSASFARRSERRFHEEQRILTGRLNIALASARMGAWSIDLRNGQTWRSQDHDRIFGHQDSLPFWNQSVFMEHVHEEDRAQVEHSQKEITSGGAKGQRIDFRIRRHDDQSVRWVRVTSQLLRDEQGRPQQLVGVVRDITEERAVEQERLMEAEWTKAVLNSTNYSVIATDENGTIQTFNFAAEEMLGYQAKELIGTSTPAVLHDISEVQARAARLSEELGEKIDPGFQAFVAKARKLETADENEWTYIRKDGSRFPVKLSVTVLKDHTGNVTGYLGVAIDLTEQKRGQEALRVAHARLERVIEATGEGIWERDLTGQEIRYIDAQGKRIFGFALQETPTYLEISGLVHKDDLARVGAYIEEIVADGGGSFEVEYRIHNRANPNLLRWIRTRGKIERVDGKPARIVATLRDVTREVVDRQRLEEALKAANAGIVAKSTFLASMSHEIRTPLNGIIGMTDLLLETELSEDQRRFAQVVQNSGTALLDLINDILDFSKIESGKLEIESSVFSLPLLVESQCDLLAAKAGQKNISLMTFLSPGLPQSVRGDSARVAQILLNLIGNAVKFTSKGGVSVRVLPVGGLDGFGSLTVRFEVEDTGIGVPDDAAEKLFRPFTQANAGISHEFGGTGLGLSISKQLAEAMGGRIGYHSSPGKGSTFWFEAPLAVMESADFLARHPRVESLRHVRVLIVEADPVAAEVVGRYVSSWRMREAAYAGYQEALGVLREAQAQRDPFGIAVIGFGTGEGIALGQQISRELGERAPKLLLLTEFGESLDINQARQGGFAEVLRKPLKQSHLFDSFSRAWFGEETEALAPEPLPVAGNEHKVRVLVADDVKTNRMLSVGLLEQLGYYAYAVGSGVEALAALAQMRFDLVLMDCLMPEMDGLEATRNIRKLSDPRLRSIPIIALTANVSAEEKARCSEAGMNAFLAKPLIRNELERTLDSLLLAESAPEERVKLLLVDDHDENRTLILNYLKALPYAVDVAVNGQDAVEKFREGGYHIVLMDMRMPVKDGYQATMEIRAWEASAGFAPAKIIALTANAMTEEVERSLKMGCDGHLSKPIRKQKLLDSIAQFLGKERKAA